MASPSNKPKSKLNMRSTAVKRIMQEAAELARDANGENDFVAGPLEEDLFDWHCTMRGVEGSEFEGGIYHFRIVLPPQYPMAAPDIILLTPNGRFELGKKICIDGLTSFHAGSWQPAWGVRTAVLGLRSFWMQQGEALSAVGALDTPKAERRRLAKLSTEWVCPCCGVPNRELLPERSAEVVGPAGSVTKTDAVAELAKEPVNSAVPAELSLVVSERAEDAADGQPPGVIPHTSPEGPRGARREPEPRPETKTRPQPSIPQSELSALTAQIPRRASASRAVPLWLDACLGLAIFAFVVLVFRRLA